MGIVRARTVLALVVGGILLLALIPTVTTVHWGGSFGQNEYQITFVDRNHQPVRGVELRVEDPVGHTYEVYPVSEYAPGRIPTSDERGLMMFHHIDRGAEFHGMCHESFWGTRWGDCDSPVYVCRFLLRGHEIYRCTLSHLGRDRTDDTVTREWDWRQELDAWRTTPLPGENHQDAYNRLRKSFDKDRNGRLNMEERTAWNHAASFIEWLPNIRLQDASEPGRQPDRKLLETLKIIENLEFTIVRRTVTVEYPP